MADLTTALRTRLLSDAGLLDLLADADGVFPDKVPQGRGLPAVRYEALSDRRLRTISGPSSLRLARVQFDAVAARREAADAIGRAIERILDGWRGALPETRDGESPSVWVDDLSLDNSYAREDPPAPGSDEPLRRRTVDFEVSYQHDALPPSE